MPKTHREFQIFVKPIGALCNLDCGYCYYLQKEGLYPDQSSFQMSDDVLEEYIVQHIEASPDPVVGFSWHGGEPTLLGLDYFRQIVALQRKHCPPGRRVTNGIQTNGTLLDEDWGRFLGTERFAVGISLDGPGEMHDRFRVTKGGGPTHADAVRGYEILRKHRVLCEALCVVHAHNVQDPTQVYRFFKEIGAEHLSFLPLVEHQPEADGGAGDRSVPAEAWGDFLCTIFDEWKARDIGRIKFQIFEEAARTAFGQAHTLCIFRETCGDVPVIEHNGDFYSCDHYVDVDHRLGNIKDTPWVEMLENPAQRAFGQAKLDSLPGYCRSCEVRSMCNGGCPKNRFISAPDGEPGLNYLCAGYKRFFTHCRPFVSQIAELWRQQTPLQAQRRPASRQARARTGRNEPCPCGSGRKYKHCCMGK